MLNFRPKSFNFPTFFSIFFLTFHSISACFSTLREIFLNFIFQFHKWILNIFANKVINTEIAFFFYFFINFTLFLILVISLSLLGYWYWGYIFPFCPWVVYFPVIFILYHRGVPRCFAIVRCHLTLKETLEVAWQPGICGGLVYRLWLALWKYLCIVILWLVLVHRDQFSASCWRRLVNFLSEDQEQKEAEISTFS